MRYWLTALVAGFFTVIFGWCNVLPSFADWTPLVTSGMFTGMQADVMTAAGGIISVAIILLGVGLILRCIH